MNLARRRLFPSLALAGSLALPLVAAGQGLPTLSPAARRFVRVDAPTIALTHVRVIDGTGAPARADQTVIIRGGRIFGVGPSPRLRPPTGATVLDLTGHTLTPGFVGMHEHTYFRSTTKTSQMSTSGPQLYLASGVTTIRTAGSMFPYSEINMKRAIEQGDVVGPRMHITGPYLNGTSTADGLNRAVATVEEARRVVAYWGEEGATWLKFSGNITRSVLGAAIDEAHKHRMKVTGHLCSVTFTEAAALGIDGLEHGFITNSDYVPDKSPDVCPPSNMRVQADVDVASPAVQQSIRQLVNHNVALTSTLAVYETFVKERATLPPRAMEMLAPDIRAEVEADHAQLGTDGFVIPERLLGMMMVWERDFVRAGGLLAAGVDPWGTGMLPGFGDLRNYELLVEAGFSPETAIQIMSLNGARALGEEQRLGSIAPDKVADLVVIRGDPTTRPSDIYNVVTVFKDGIGYDSAKLFDASKGLVGIR